MAETENNAWLATLSPTALQPNRSHVWVEHQHPDLYGLMSVCGLLACRPVGALYRNPRIGHCPHCVKRLSGIPKHGRAADYVAEETASA